MRTTALARRYASALVKIGQEDASYERIGKDLRSLLSVFKGNPELYKVLLNPMYKLEQRRLLTEKISGNLGVSKVVERFMDILVTSRKIGLLEGICLAYFKMEDELAGRLRGTVEAPVELDETLRGAIKRRIEEETKKEVILSFEKNPELIGGVVLRIGNTVVDGSLKAQLERVTEKILEGVV
jgi:F-type H+-transporting ATPase subunit delta